LNPVARHARERACIIVYVFLMISDWASERNRMVERQIWARGIRNERVLAAMREIPREQFVPIEWREHSYDDEPLPIGYDQTISQPYMTALMVQELDLKGTETVLDVGAGSGYHAAVLSALAGKVVSIEIIPELARVAEENLGRIGRLDSVLVVCGDGSSGCSPLAPYDAISVAAAAPDIPAQLLDQLQDPGRMVIPVGSIDDQELRVITRKAGKVSMRVATLCRFVPLRGNEGWR